MLKIMSTRIFTGTVIALCLCSIGLIVWGCVYVRQRRRNWVDVDATILSLNIPPQLLGRELSKTSRTGHSIEIEYAYIWNSKEYKSRRVTPSDAVLPVANAMAFAQQLDASLQSGKQIVVQVDRDNPEIAVLTTDVGFLVPILMAVFSVGFGSLLLFNA
jgi:hypothetical protein